ncbi:hypothetical protein [Nonomuraea sp. NPDC050643]|uniref:hypothetical protein n=1 Tax=Nonomuraea sp. NPDC050643 TaxID=3155660 RepID=UPI0033C7B542
MSDYRESAEAFARDTAGHEMTVLLDQGLHRHLRFQKPKSGNCWFEIVTWPGSLAIRGDIDGGYIFTRTTDMFEFFRRSGHNDTINPGYWAEKTEGGRDGCRSYSADRFRQRVAEYFDAHAEDDAFERAVVKLKELGLDGDNLDALPKAAAEECARATAAHMKAVREAFDKTIDGFWAEYNVEYEDEARNALNSFDFYDNPDDRYDPEKRPDFEFCNTWDWDFKDPGYWFLWCCHAIAWAIRQYDAAKSADKAEVAHA